MHRIILAGLMILGAAPCAVAESQAHLAFFAFDNTLPLSGLQLKSADGHIGMTLIGTTNENGAIFASLPTGDVELILTAGDDSEPLATVPLTLIDDEVIQVMVTLGALGASYAVESSNPANEGGPAATREPEIVGDPGTLIGTVTSAESGDPVPGARIFISGVSADIRTDETGKFEAFIPADTYALSVIADNFSTQTVNDIVIEADAETPVQIEVTPAGLELPDFVVIEPFVEGSLAAVLDEQRNTSAVANVLGAEAIARSGDSDAGSALKRVTGLTLVGGKFIYVRGLGERYSTTLVNGAIIPSPDPTRRVVPLDLFPVTIIDSILVQKSFSPEMPADFGGGTVLIRTTGVPKGAVLSLGGSLAYLDGTTGDDFTQSPGGSDDYYGYDDGSRDFGPLLSAATADGKLTTANFLNPDGLSREEIEAVSEETALFTPYDLEQQTAKPDSSWTLSLGDVWSLSDSVSAGARGAIRHSQSFDISEEERREFSVSGTNLRRLSDLEIERSTREVELSGFATAGISFGDNHSIGSTLMLLRQTTDETSVAEGIDFNADTNSRFSQVDYEENQLRAFQIGGQHDMPGWLGNVHLDWQYTDASAERDAPRQLAYRYDEEDGVFQFSEQSDRFQQNTEALVDESEQYQGGLYRDFEFSPKTSLRIRGDFSKLERSRDSVIRRFTYFDGNRVDEELLAQPLDSILVPDNIGPAGTGLFVLREVTRATDAYLAAQDLKSMAFTFDLRFLSDFRVTLGARKEENLQTVTTFEPFNPDAAPLISVLEEDDWFPAALFTWEYSDTSQIRATYSETINRPEFREISPASFTDPRLDQEVSGFPDLVSAPIKHYDLRWEKYFSPTENLSVALFHKEMENPIEQIVIPGETRISTFRNALVGELTGIEVDYNQGLGRLWEPLESFTLGTNVAYIQSEVQLPEGVGANTNLTRELQGQSPFVVNSLLGYESPDGDIKATLLFNVFGERISEAGAQGLPDILEQPFEQVDFVYKHSFSDAWQFTLKVRNLLDPDVEFTQGGEVERSFKRGREVSLGLTWRPL